MIDPMALDGAAPVVVVVSAPTEARVHVPEPTQVDGRLARLRAPEAGA